MCAQKSSTLAKRTGLLCTSAHCINRERALVQTRPGNSYQREKAKETHAYFSTLPVPPRLPVQGPPLVQGHPVVCNADVLSQVAVGPLPCTPRTVLPPASNWALLISNRALVSRVHQPPHRLNHKSKEATNLRVPILIAVRILHVCVQAGTGREADKTKDVPGALCEWGLDEKASVPRSCIEGGGR